MLKRRAFLAGLAALPATARAADVLSACKAITIQAGGLHNWTQNLNGVTCSNGTAAAPTGSTWSSADATVSAITLSNGNLTATPGPGGGWQTIRNTASKTSGLLYVEFKAGGGNQYNTFGLASAGITVTADLGLSNYSCGITLSNNATIVSSGFTANITAVGAVYTPVAGDVVALAVNFTTGQIWIAYNNAWLASGNPAAGTTPFVTFVLATTGALFAAMSQTSGGGAWTFQPTAASQKYAPPTGFSPWG